MSERVPMTQRGYDRLKAQLHQLKTVDRPQNVREIEDARSHGDISENAEYHAAKERQSLLARQISIVEDKLARAQVIELPTEAPDQIRFGATVVLEDSDSGETTRYQLVGEDESDATQGLISVTSPIARALLGKEVGDSVRVTVPKGTREFDVLEILGG
jgi:transcription elongation factor GreA